MLLLVEYNPSKQEEVLSLKLGAFSDEFPTLGKIKKELGEDVRDLWLGAQLQDLCKYTGVKEKLSIEQLKQLSRTIAINWGYLTVAELMVFFVNLKSGCYGQFYGSIDPIKITTAIREYLPYRNEMKEKWLNQKEMARKKMEEERYKRELAQARAKGYKSTLEMYLAEKKLSKESMESIEEHNITSIDDIIKTIAK